MFIFGGIEGHYQVCRIHLDGFLDIGNLAHPYQYGQEHMPTSIFSFLILRRGSVPRYSSSEFVHELVVSFWPEFPSSSTFLHFDEVNQSIERNSNLVTTDLM